MHKHQAANSHLRYPNVFNPIQVGPVEIPNRFYFAPHGIGLSVGSQPSADLSEYSSARVRNNGCGLVVVSLTVHERPRAFQPSPYCQENILAFRALADSVHAEGGKIFGEVGYHWMSSGQWEPFSPGAPILTPSTAHFSMAGRSSSTYAMPSEDVSRMIDAFGVCVRHLREAGFDGVMIHSAHAELLEQFISPYFNRRTDKYGGTLDNRVRFLKDVLSRARSEARFDMAVGMRFNANEIIKGGYGIETARDVLKYLCRHGLLDFVDLDIALEPVQMELGMPPMFLPKQIYRPYVEAVRDAVGAVPVLSVLGRVTSIEEAEAALEAGVCDMVGAARALIAEPQLVSNAFAGKEDRSRTCIACNWCLAAMSEGSHGCAINPASYRERRWGDDKLELAPNPSRVVILGAGPSGLEAARVAALRGHEVTLFDQRDILGGGLALWAKLPGREALQESVNWWSREVTRLGVGLRLGQKPSAEGILALEPDAVILATGAIYSPTGRSASSDRPIPGWDQEYVYCPEAVLLGGTMPVGKVVVYDADGSHGGVGIAEILGSAGAEVFLATPGFSPVSPRMTETQEAKFIVKRLLGAGVTLLPNTTLRSIGDRSITVACTCTDSESSIEDLSAVVLATGREPENQEDLVRHLVSRVPQVFVVGDALGARSLAAAVYEGHKFARLIGVPGAPASAGEAYFRSDDADVMPIRADLHPSRQERIVVEAVF